MTNGKQTLTLIELQMFLEHKGGFAPKIPDMEAILRRCDHDADRRLNLEEFSELFRLESEPPRLPISKQMTFSPRDKMSSPKRDLPQKIDP